MKEQRINVLKILHDPDKKHEKYTHVALPGHLYLKQNEGVIFSAKNTDVTIWIPNAHMLFDNAKDDFIIRVTTEKESETYTVKKDCKSGSEFPFAVYCSNGNNLAEGNSPPRMIIE